MMIGLDQLVLRLAALLLPFLAILVGLLLRRRGRGRTRNDHRFARNPAGNPPPPPPAGR